MYIEVHLLQNFAPSNLNRDDTGNPKDCEFGGTRRARISSQCLKRAIRTAPIFAETSGVDIGIRTRYITRKLSKALASSQKPEQEVADIVGAIAAAYSSKKDEMDSEDPTRTKVALYLSPADIEWTIQEILKHWDDLVAFDAEEDKAKKGKKASQNPFLSAIVSGLMTRTKKHTDAPDIALFGRMLADYPDTNVDAACQVAHAISTHRVTMEMDFFTAVDEMMEPGETGASMMGFTGFDSACFYRYARLDWEQLLKNLDGDVALARRTVEAFLRAVEAIPTGKQNTFAAHNPPSFRLAVAREGGFAWSLANAFEKPVRPQGDSGLVAPSLTALEKYWQEQLLSVYGDASLKQTAALAPGLALNTFTPVADLEAWITAIMEALPKEA